MTPATCHRVTRALGRALAVLTLAALTLAVCPACSSPPGLGSSGALSRAEQWFAAYHDALRQGAFNVGPFYADDARIDLTTLEGPQVAGRESVLQTIGGAFVAFRNQTRSPVPSTCPGRGRSRQHRSRAPPRTPTACWPSTPSARRA